MKNMTPHDLEIIRKAIEGLENPDCMGCTDCADPMESDCFNSVLVVTSEGYLEVDTTTLETFEALR